MANMSYCRFENTVQDMEDCIDTLCENNYNLEDMMENASSKYEAQAMQRFIDLCYDVVEALGDD